MTTRAVRRAMAIVIGLMILSLTVAAGGAAFTNSSHESGAASTDHMNHGAPAASAVQPSTVKGRLPQPQVAPPVGQRDAQVVQVELEVKEVQAEIDDGVVFDFWTFNGTVPGPMIRVREDDTVELTLKNPAGSAAVHSIDLHAVTGPGGGATVMQVNPNGEGKFSFKAMKAGVYVYHCATPPVPMHISNGMYGMVVVEPPEGLPHVDREFYVMQGDFYLTGERGEPGLHAFDMNKMLDENPTYVVFNGSVGALTGENALQAKTGETVRIFFGVGGVNLSSSFHVIGEIFDNVAVEGGTLVNHNVQTTTVAPGGATMVEFKVDVPGNYTLVDHSLGRAMKGAGGMLHVEGPENPEIFKSIVPGNGGTGGH